MSKHDGAASPERRFPAAWRARRWALVLGGPTFVATGVLLVLVGAVASDATAGSTGTRLGLVGAGVVALGMGVPGCTAIGEARRRATNMRVVGGSDPGLELRASTWRVLAAGFALATFAAILPLGLAALLGSAGLGAGWAAAAGLGLAAVLVAWTVLGVRRQQHHVGGGLARPRVLLDRQGVEVRGLLGTHRIGWDQEPHLMPAPNRTMLFLDAATLDAMADGKDPGAARLARRLPRLQPGLYDAGLVTVAAAVFHYAALPEHRVELGTESALRRLASGDHATPPL